MSRMEVSLLELSLVSPDVALRYNVSLEISFFLAYACCAELVFSFACALCLHAADWGGELRIKLFLTAFPESTHTQTDGVCPLCLPVVHRVSFFLRFFYLDIFPL